MIKANFAKNFSNSALPSSRGGTLNNTKIGRVVDIILDENHPQYEGKGGSRSINGVFYLTVGQSTKTSSDEKIARFAYCSDVTLSKPPIPGELVELVTLQGPSLIGGTKTKSTYYTKILNYWNNPNTNTFLDTYTFPDQDITFGGLFKENPTINPLKPLVGDVLIQGRQGQSIRFTGTQNEDVNWEHTTRDNDPLTIISNGQINTDDGFTLISEDVNEDPSSMYLTSNQIIPLKPASTRYKTYNESPEGIESYDKRQIILNSGRVVINSKESDILNSSNKSISLDAKTSVNIESNDYICIDSEKIFLGEKARTAPQNVKEPVLLGNQTENFLESLLNLLVGMSQDMANAQTVDGKPIPLLNKRGIQAQATLRILKNSINPNGKSNLKSKKVFTE